jgi:hypothetical protein
MGAGATIGALILLAFYFLPVFISVSRQTGNAIAVFLVCLFFGWTVVGWIIALIMAFGKKTNSTTVVNVHYGSAAQEQVNARSKGA